MKCECVLETRVSSKTGNSYKCLVIKLTDNYEKFVFLTNAEIALLEKNNNSSMFE